ncbi:MAG: J domain-containing protein [Bacteriovorax sp.]|jgi:DnaJ-class molecular chaperone
MTDPYKTLGVSKSSTQDEIKKAYRNLVKKHHPDLNPGNKQAEAKFKEISHAYELIGTPENRLKFDRGETDQQQHEAQAEQQRYWEEALRGDKRKRKSTFYNTQQNGGRYSHSFGEEFVGEDFFEDLFRKAGHKQTRPTKGTDTLYQMNVTLAESVLGAEKVITLPNGKNISVKIPQGISSGTKLRFKGLGESGADDYPPGDAFIEIIVTPMKAFKRVGNDIETEINISFIEAILGAEISVPTLYGPVMMKIPAGVNNGSRLRIRGKGVQSSSGSGSQIVEIKIIMPKIISPELHTEVRSWHGRFDYNPRSSTPRNEKSEKQYNV